jgi:hypothetical protein
MKKQSFKLFELLNLEIELSGFVNPETGERIFEGLASQKISATTKYWISTLLETLANEKKLINAIREDLIKKYGKEDESGNVGIDRLIPSGNKDEEGNDIMMLNPTLREFNEEYNQILQQEKSIRIPSIQLSELSEVKTSDHYPLIFKYMIEAPIEPIQTIDASILK